MLVVRFCFPIIYSIKKEVIVEINKIINVVRFEKSKFMAKSKKPGLRWQAEPGQKFRLIQSKMFLQFYFLNLNKPKV